MCRGLLVRMAPRFSANADSKELKAVCFVTPLQLLILKGLAKRGFWAMFESWAEHGASAAGGDGTVSERLGGG
jgi:hypothetical protein